MGCSLIPMLRIGLLPNEVKLWYLIAANQSFGKKFLSIMGVQQKTSRKPILCKTNPGYPVREHGEERGLFNKKMKINKI